MPADLPRRVLGYARVSSAEQALGSSLDDQQASLSAYAKARGVDVHRFFVESESGGREKIERREQMQALLREVRSGDLVLVDKLDRWSRDPEFTYGSVRKVLEAGAHIFVVAEGIDPSTRDGDTHLNFRILFAREEHKRIRERTVGTRQLLRDRGYYVEGTPPFGYRRAKPKGFKGPEKNVLVVVPEDAELVRTMFRRAAAGRSLTQIAEELGLDKSRIHKSLRSRHYLGELRNSKREWVRGPHEALVTADVYERAQAAMAARKLGGARPKGAKAETDTWILRDLATCARCGAKMGAAYAGPKGPRRRHYYRCIHKCRSLGNRANNNAFVPVVPLEQAVSALILGRLEELRDELARGPELATTPKANFAERRAKLERRRAKHIEAHAEEVITLAELRARLAKLDGERLALNAEEAAAGALARVSDPAVRRAMLREVKTLQRGWEAADVAGKRVIAAQLAVTFRIAADVLPSPEWRSLVELVTDLG